MLSSQSSNCVSDKRNLIPWTDLATWICREFLGFVFVFSGFVKAIDVWGTFYKFNEYLVALGLPVYDNLTLTAVFFLCGLEFLTGIFLVFGCYRKSSVIIALCFMCVMLPLTLWIAVSDPVADCGCFGDALVLSNWATFWKNVVLTLCVIWLLCYNRRIPCIITPAFQWMAILASSVFIVAVGWYGYMIQPMIDFRPFPIGTSLVSEDTDYNGPEYAFIYRKGNETREFTEDNLPDDEDGWEFVSRRELPFPDRSAEKKDDKHDFRILNQYGTEDVTEDVISEDGAQFILLIPSLKDISASTTYKINMLYDWAEQHDVEMIAVLAPHSGDMNEWIDLSMPKYDIYTAEDTSIKELSRGNPSVVYLDKGVIKWKSTLAALNEDDFATPDSKTDILSFAPDTSGTLKHFVWLYLIIMAILVAISFVPRLTRLFHPLAAKKLNLRE